MEVINNHYIYFECGAENSILIDCIAVLALCADAAKIWQDILHSRHL